MSDQHAAHTGSQTAAPAKDKLISLPLTICALVIMCEGFYLAASGLIAPSMMAELGLGKAQFGFTITALMLGFFVGATFGGIFGDRHSRKMVISLSFLIVGLSTAIATAWMDYPLIVGMRAVAGLGLGAALPNILALAASLVAPQFKGRAVALASLGANLGGMTTGVLMMVMGSALTWRPMFWLAALSTVIFLPLLTFVKPAPMTQHRTAAPKAWEALMGEGRVSRTLLLWAVSFLISLNFYGISSWAGSLLSMRGVPAPVIGLGAAISGAATMIGTFLYATLLDNGRRSLAAGIALLGTMPTLLLFLNVDTPVGVVGTMALVGLTVLASSSLTLALVPAAYPPWGQATGMGATLAASRSGAIIAPTILGVVLDTGIKQPDLAYIMIPPAFMALLCILALLRRLPSVRL